jgi:hypothetical protein
VTFDDSAKPASLDTPAPHQFQQPQGGAANQSAIASQGGGNRKLNATIHRMAMIQLRFEPRARTLFDHARNNGHTRRESMRILKRHLAAVIYRTMLRDAIAIGA